MRKSPLNTCWRRKTCRRWVWRLPGSGANNRAGNRYHVDSGAAFVLRRCMCKITFQLSWSTQQLKLVLDDMYAQAELKYLKNKWLWGVSCHSPDYGSFSALRFCRLQSTQFVLQGKISLLGVINACHSFFHGALASSSAINNRLRQPMIGKGNLMMGKHLSG